MFSNVKSFINQSYEEKQTNEISEKDKQVIEAHTTQKKQEQTELFLVNSDFFQIDGSTIEKKQEDAIEKLDDNKKNNLLISSEIINGNHDEESKEEEKNTQINDISTKLSIKKVVSIEYKKKQDPMTPEITQNTIESTLGKFNCETLKIANWKYNGKQEDYVFPATLFPVNLDCVNNKPVIIGGVFDGNGGSEVSQFAIEYLADYQFDREDFNAEGTLSIAFFNKLNIAIGDYSRNLNTTMCPGSTMVLTQIFEDSNGIKRIALYSVGDSRGIILKNGQIATSSFDMAGKDVKMIENLDLENKLGLMDIDFEEMEIYRPLIISGLLEKIESLRTANNVDILDEVAPIMEKYGGLSLEGKATLIFELVKRHKEICSAGGVINKQGRVNYMILTASGLGSFDAYKAEKLIPNTHQPLVTVVDYDPKDKMKVYMVTDGITDQLNNDEIAALNDVNKLSQSAIDKKSIDNIGIEIISF